MRGTGVAIDIAEAVQSVVGRENIRTGEEARPYRLGEIDPQVVAFPANEDGVSKVLALAWREGFHVVPWGGGAHQGIGHAPTGYEVALDLGRMNRLLEYEPGDMTATVQCGIRMTDLQAQVGKHGQFFPLDPPLAERATLGGILATSLSGPLRCRYGAVRDLTLGIRIVHADGTITKGGAKVVKNATAYDITKLYLGSLGTLGVMVVASVRLYPRPPVERAWEFSLPDLGRGQALADHILGSHCVPTRVELLDRGDGRRSLFVSCAGILEAVEAQAGVFRQMAAEVGAVPMPVAQPVLTFGDISDFPWRSFPGDGGTPRAIWRVGLLPRLCAEGIHALREAAGLRGTVRMAASVAAGIIRGETVTQGTEELASHLAAAREAVAGLGGYLVVLGAPAAVRARVDVWGEAPDGFSLMQQVKDSFDPRRILSPGRFLGGI